MTTCISKNGLPVGIIILSCNIVQCQASANDVSQFGGMLEQVAVFVLRRVVD